MYASYWLSIGAPRCAAQTYTTPGRRRWWRARRTRPRGGGEEKVHGRRPGALPDRRAPCDIPKLLGDPACVQRRAGSTHLRGNATGVPKGDGAASPSRSGPVSRGGRARVSRSAVCGRLGSCQAAFRAPAAGPWGSGRRNSCAWRHSDRLGCRRGPRCDRGPPRRGLTGSRPSPAGRRGPVPPSRSTDGRLHEIRPAEQGAGAVPGSGPRAPSACAPMPGVRRWVAETPPRPAAV